MLNDYGVWGPKTFMGRTSDGIHRTTFVVDEEDEKFSFHEGDLIYRHFKQSKKECSNAVIFFIMDISGSMTKTKKFLARSFFFLLYHFVRSKYNHTEIVFVSHDTEGYEVNEDQFFTRGNSGGTKVSSGLCLVDDIIKKRFHPSSWNIYAFQCSDGDNWPDDTAKTLEVLEKIKKVSQMFGYCEIGPEIDFKSIDKDSPWQSSKLSNVYLPHADKKMKMSRMAKKKDVWPAFKKFFGGK